MSKLAHRLRSRLTYANAMSTLAMFSVLGGSAYAATKLPRNSVSSTQVRDGSLRARDLAPGAALPPAFSADNPGPDTIGVERGGPAPDTVAMKVPAGSYAIFGKVTVSAVDAESRGAVCTLWAIDSRPRSSGPDFARLDTAVASVNPPHEETISLEATFRMTAPRTVIIGCNAGSSRNHNMASDSKLIAVPVSGIK